MNQENISDSFEALFIEILDIREQLTIYEQAYQNGNSTDFEQNYAKAQKLAIQLVEKGEKLVEMFKESNKTNQSLVKTISQLEQKLNDLLDTYSSPANSYRGPSGVGSAT